MSSTQEKNRLIEEMGVHFENIYNFPPLAARIYSSLILAEKEGLTFEECIITHGASKSSISTALNLLLKTGIITYFTEHGDRRRYFKLSEKNSFLINKLSENLKKAENERNIIEKVVTFNKGNNPKKYRENRAKTALFLKYLDKNETLLRQTIKELHHLKTEKQNNI